MHSAVKRVGASLLGLLLWVLWPGVAAAHAVLKRASPAAGAVLAQAPSEIRLLFNETIEPRFSQIELMTSKGIKINTGRLAVDPANRSEILVSVPLLEPGRYKIKWRVLSVDSHKVEGELTFELKR